MFCNSEESCSDHKVSRTIVRVTSFKILGEDAKRTFPIARSGVKVKLHPLQKKKKKKKKDNIIFTLLDICEVAVTSIHSGLPNISNQKKKSATTLEEEMRGEKEKDTPQETSCYLTV